MLELKNIKKSYKTGDFVQHALKGVSLQFRKSEFVAILGPSGSGKTTLLNVIGGLDRYDTGDLILNEKSTKKFKDKDWDAYRNNCVGFIFQSYNLISHIDILSNVEMAMTLSGISSKKRKEKAKEVLKRVGLEAHMHKKPNQLSGGQMQRVAIARAIVNNPDIILADEPTGALDSKTSVSIMNLIKEVAQDKLVIMVTHNPELAKSYASRIVEMKDGEIIHDSNPYEKKDESVDDLLIRKTSMNFLTALQLSFHNIKTKKGRTLLTSFASSIGIIGIALILSLSNGFDKQINSFEETTLSALPVIISKQSMNLDQESLDKMQNEMTSKEDDYPDIDYVLSQKNEELTYSHTNPITQEYMDYLNQLSSKDVLGINYYYSMNFPILQKNQGKVSSFLSSSLSMSSIPHSIDSNNSYILKQRYDILAGREATSYDEVLIEVDSKNRVSEDILKVLGFTNQRNVSFASILNSGFKIALNDLYYEKHGNYYMPRQDLDTLYEDDGLVSLKVVGIVRLKSDYPKVASNRGILYTHDLCEYMMNHNASSSIVMAQKKALYNVMSGEVFDLSMKEGREAKEAVLAFLGDKVLPYVIHIFPKDFDSKERVLAHLDKYNEGKKEEEKIVYMDQANLMSSLSSNIMDAITIVLIAFSSISLVVSSIMIGIIMYISVLERTKEIGILRSLGARKKDISRVFNAETFIIGVSSGLLGIFIACILLIPTNLVLKELTNLDNVAILNPIHALVLILVSVCLTLIGGAIPSHVASKKDPVISLRTE